MIPWFCTGHRAETIRKAENPPLPPGVQELPSLSLLQPHTYFSYVTTLVFGITVLLTHTVISQGDQHKSITSDFLSLFSGKQHRANQGGNEPSLRAFLAGLCLEAVLCRAGVMAPATSAGSSPRLLQQRRAVAAAGDMYVCAGSTAAPGAFAVVAESLSCFPFTEVST